MKLTGMKDLKKVLKDKVICFLIGLNSYLCVLLLLLVIKESNFPILKHTGRIPSGHVAPIFHLAYQSSLLRHKHSCS